LSSVPGKKAKKLAAGRSPTLPGGNPLLSASSERAASLLWHGWRSCAIMASMSDGPIHLAFEGGTLVATGATPERLAALPYSQHDPRPNVSRAEGRHYRALVEHLRREQIPYTDAARTWQPTPWRLRTSRDPFPHQVEALEAWWKGGGRGVVVLPTGT